MEPNANTIVRVLKQLRAAVGYHELGMSRQAMRCLDSLASFGDIGQFALAAELLRGEFSKSRENRVTADKAPEIAAGLLPVPARRAVQMTLAACYGPVNYRGRDANARGLLRGALPQVKPKPAR